MLRRVLTTGSALALLGAGLVVAQAPPPPPAAPAAQPGTAATMKAWRAKQILGSKVSIQGNVEIGTVDDFVLSDEGVVQYLIVANAGKLVTVPWEAAKFNFEHRTATVNITQQQFQAIPTYTVERYPDYFTPAYRTQVYQWYGLTPGQERRLERRLNR